MSVTHSDPSSADAQATTAPVPKRITNAQTVCNEKNEKGKLCNGHLKQLRTAGEPAEIHLRGDDVLFKCQTCGTLYMGPPLGHVRDPQKQRRFVEAELSALLQAAGGTLPVIKKDARGVFVLVEAGEHGHSAKPAAPKPTAAAPPQGAAAAPVGTKAAPVAQKPTPKAGAQPNRNLLKRSTYVGVADTGPVPGETFEQKVARLQAVSLAAKRRAEEGGGETATVVDAEVQPSVAPVAEKTLAPSATTVSDTVPPAAAVLPPKAPAASTAVAKPTGKADRTLMKRSTYGAVVDTGPVPNETFEQKVARLSALAAAAKQRADEGGQ